MLIELLATTVLAAVSSAVLCPLVMSVGIWDNPDAARKTHRLPTPTSGGLAVASAFAVAIAALTFWPWSEWSQSTPWQGFMRIACCCLAGFGALCIGLWDDLQPLGPRLKFGLMTGFALWLSAVVAHAQFFPLAGGTVVELPYVVGVLGSALWIFTLTNTVNFMDGANGLSMGSMAVGQVALGTIAMMHGVPHAGALAFLCAGALVGLLVWNFPRGQVFAGDAGALFVGMLTASLALVVVQDGQVSPVVPALVFFPLLADVLLTLAYRAKRKRPMMDGHREHLFQIGLRGGLKHWQISLIYWGATLHCGVIATLVSLGPTVIAPLGLNDAPPHWEAFGRSFYWIASASPLLALAAFAVVAVRISGRVRAFAEAQGLTTP